MLIEIKAEDENGIVTTIQLNEDIREVEGLEKVFKKFTLFLLKNGADLPEEIAEELLND
tara:strand:- start:1524 stop:1700 length:177 start_codon:yes stop_codon:yes gene_type:complete